MSIKDKLQKLTTRISNGSAEIDIWTNSFRILLQDSDCLTSKAIRILLEEDNIKLIFIHAENNRISIIGRFDI